MMNRRRQSATWKDRVITIQLLNRQSRQININPKCRYSQILEQICSQLGLTDTSIFGLALKTDQAEYRFLDLSAKVCKRLLDQCLPSKGSGNVTASPNTYLYLRVQNYVEACYSFRTETDRKYYFQQLKENYLRYGFHYPDDRCFLLASYAIHADETKWHDFDPREYFPGWVLKRYGTQFVRRHMPTIMPDGITAAQAMNTYIKELCTPSPYAYNIRLYRLQSSKVRPTNDTRLAICPHGLELYEVNSDGYLNYLTCCQWSEIKSVSSNKRRLDVSLENRCLSFYTSTDTWCQVLSYSVRASRAHYLGLNHRLEEERCPSTLEFLESSFVDDMSFRESYIYSDENDLEWEYEQSILGTLPSSGSKQNKCKGGLGDRSGSSLESASHHNRYSIVSSSTNTSGIVSDRICLSAENSQEDLLDSSICQSSCDSLLNSSSCVAGLTSQLYKSRAVTVQRAISEPSKKFDELRLQVRRAPADHHIPRRAVSDETVDDHDYENVAIIRKTLAIQAAANRRSQSSVTRLCNSKGSLVSDSGSSLAVYPNSTQSNNQSRKPSLSSINKLNSSSSSSSNHRYSLISTSPSMERLLIDYTPPPSYNETHARQREVILAASRSNSQDLTTAQQGLQLSQTSAVYPPSHTPSSNSHAASSSLTIESSPSPKYYQKRQMSVPDHDAVATSTPTPVMKHSMKGGCSCQKLSHPEIDKLRTEVKDLVSLPMISALCNDKELQRSANLACSCGSTDTMEPPASPRPISWHCEVPQAFSFPISSSHRTGQTCH